MTSYLCRKKVLKKIDGFDESIDYGEDADLPLRAKDEGFKPGNTEAVIYYHFVSSISEVFSQGRWYGKSLMSFLKKHPENFPSFLMMLFFFLWPITNLISFFGGLNYLAFLQNICVLFYVLAGFYRTRNFYILFVPIIKTVRAYGGIVGILESFYTEDIGKS